MADKPEERYYPIVDATLNVVTYHEMANLFWPAIVPSEHNVHPQPQKSLELFGEMRQSKLETYEQQLEFLRQNLIETRKKLIEAQKLLIRSSIWEGEAKSQQKETYLGSSAEESGPPTPTVRIRQLEKENGDLRLQNQLLQSRVAEERRTAARETQRYDQLLQEHKKLVECLSGCRKANNDTLELLLGRHNARMKMIERYEGVVEHVHGESVTVVFEIDEDIVEHTYHRSQFVGGNLPKKGDQFTVFVHVVHGPVEMEENSSAELDELNEHQEYPRKKITGPVEF